MVVYLSSENSKRFLAALKNMVVAINLEKLLEKGFFHSGCILNTGKWTNLWKEL